MKQAKTITINGITFKQKIQGYFNRNGNTIYDLYKKPSDSKVKIYKERSEKITITGIEGNSMTFTIYGIIKDNKNKKEYKVMITKRNNYILLNYN